ncbi:MAG: cation:proton antiporter [Elainellaceae cyanobacterium]
MSLLLWMSSLLLPCSKLNASPNLGFSLSFNLLDRLPFLDRLPIDDPVTIFLVIVGVMLIAPLLFERLGLPGIVGLILAGMAIGPHGANLLARDETIVLLGTVGLLFLMFLGGLETSLDDLKQNAKPAIGFGLLTFLIPMALGTGAMMLVGYGPLAAVLVASCLASHTLVALPLLSRLGIAKTRPVTATLGGTLITNVLALLVLAVVVKAQSGELTLGFWLFLIPSLLVFTFTTLWGLPRLGRWFFIRFGHDEGAEFVFVLVALFVVSYIAGLIEIEPIVGAFLVGVAITQQIPERSPLMNRIQFIGNILFVPFFLISVGMLVDPLVLIKEPRSLFIAGVIVAVELLSKYIAALLSGKLFGWSGTSSMTVFGLSVAQAASTLAAITVAFNLDIVDEATVNGTIAMILVSCIASPWITQRWGSKMEPGGEGNAATDAATMAEGEPLPDWGKRILVPVANADTENSLLELAILLSKRAAGTLLPLNVLSDRQGEISAQRQMAQQRLLAEAENLAHSAVVEVEPISRVDYSASKGIIRASVEHQASLIVCGWKGYSHHSDRTFGSVVDRVVNRATVPVLVTRFPQPLNTVERVVLAVPIERRLSATARLAFDVAGQLAEELKAPLQMLLVRSGPRSRQRPTWLEDLPEGLDWTLVEGAPVKRIAEALTQNDLLILPAQQRRYEGVLSSSRLPEAVAHRSWQTSMLVVHTPPGVSLSQGAPQRPAVIQEQAGVAEPA